MKKTTKRNLIHGAFLALSFLMLVGLWLVPWGFLRFFMAGGVFTWMGQIMYALRESQDRVVFWKKRYHEQLVRADVFECQIVGHCQHTRCIKDHDMCCWCGAEMDHDPGDVPLGMSQ